MPRRSPRRHTVHTHHPRYYLKLYPRGSRIEEMPESMDSSVREVFEFWKFDPENLSDHDKIILEGIGDRDEYFIEKAFKETDILNERESLEEKRRILRLLTVGEREAERRGFRNLAEKYRNLRSKLMKLNKSANILSRLSSEMSKASDKGDWKTYNRLKKQREKLFETWSKKENPINLMPTLSKSDLSGVRMRKGLGIEAVRKSYENKHVDGSGNFGYVLVKSPRDWYRIDGFYNSKGEITKLYVSPYGSGGRREIPPESNLDESLTIIKDFISRGG